MKTFPITISLLFYILVLVYSTGPPRDSGCPSFPLPQKIQKLPPSILQSLDDVTSILEEIRVKQNTPGVAAGVVYDQELIWSKGFGVKNKKKPDIPDLDTIFITGSVSKIFCALELLRLHEKGDIQLDDIVENIQPLFKIQNPYSPRSPIRFRDLASHMAGLPRSTPCGSGCDSKKAFSLISNMTLIHPPNVLPNYSNLGFNILGNVLADYQQMSFADLVVNHISKPLQMSNTDADITRANPKLLATPYLNDGSECTYCTANFGWQDPAGGVHSTVRDLIQIMKLYFRMFDESISFKKKLSMNDDFFLYPSTIRESIHPRFIDHDMQTAWALPWEEYRLTHLNLPHYWGISKGGNDLGWSAEFIMVPTIRLGMIVLTNLMDTAQDLGFSMANILIPAFDSYLSTLIPPNSVNLTDFVGVYKKDKNPVDKKNTNTFHNTADTITVYLNGNRLYSSLGGILSYQTMLNEQNYVFHLMMKPADQTSCYYDQLGNYYQTVLFQTNPTTKQVISLSSDMFFGHEYKKL